MNYVSSEVVVFLIIALVVIASAVAMLLSRNAVHSVLFLVTNFAAVAALYMTLGAPFIALAQVTVYAGAIMILFLFVVMLLGAERLPGNEPLRGQRVAAIGVFVVLLVEAGVMVVLRGQAGLGLLAMRPPTGSFASPADIGMALFTRYSLPFELTSVLLVVAAVGAIVLTHRPRKERRLIAPSSSSNASGGALEEGQSGAERSPIPTPLSSPFLGGERSNPSPNNEAQQGQGGEGI